MGPSVWGPAGYQTAWIMSDYEYHPEEVLYRKELFRTKNLFLSNISAIKKPLYERELDRFKRRFSKGLLEEYERVRARLVPLVQADTKQALKARRAQLKAYRSTLPQAEPEPEQQVEPLPAEQLARLGVSRGAALDREFDAFLERFIEHKFDKLSALLEDPAMDELLHQPAHVFEYAWMEEEMWDHLPQHLYARGFDHTRTWWLEDNQDDLFLRDVQHWHHVRDYKQTFSRLSRYGLRTHEPGQVPPELEHPRVGAAAAGQAPSQLYRARFQKSLSAADEPEPQDGVQRPGSSQAARTHMDADVDADETEHGGAGAVHNDPQLYELAERLLKGEEDQRDAAELQRDPNAPRTPVADLLGTPQQADMFMLGLHLQRGGGVPLTETLPGLRQLELYRAELELRHQHMSFDELLRRVDPSLPPAKQPRGQPWQHEASTLTEGEAELLARGEQLLEQARSRAFLDRPYDVVFTRRFTLSSRVPGRKDLARQLMLRHRRVKLQLNVDRLQLPPLVMERFRQLAGVRYNAASRVLTVTADQRENYWQNTQLAKQTVRALLREAYLAYPRYLPLDELVLDPPPRLYEPRAPLLEAKPIDAHIIFRLKP